MKIFALNLCLQFEVISSQQNYQFTTISFAELMSIFFKGTDFDDQKFYLEVPEDTESFLQEVIDLQAHEFWRELRATVCFLFRKASGREAFIQAFRDRFRLIDAAGGMVINEKGEYLCIYNRNRWTLPKGVLEWREDPREAAIREVKEETGIKAVEIMEKMEETYHTFKRGKKWIFKTTFWYRMKASSKEELVPQTSEDIEAVAWKTKEACIAFMKESYPLTNHLFEIEFTRSLTMGETSSS